MFLNKFYSEPEGLFETIEFIDGINFIFAKKDTNKESKKSLNGVGKSLLLNLIDYCLLSSETKHIKSAKSNNNLDIYRVVLEFEIDEKLYIIKRSFKDPNKNIVFGEKENPSNFLSIGDVKDILCDLIFKNDNYKGKYSNKWLRKLIPFFIKKQSSQKKVSFVDPIRYIHESTDMELIPLHLFLMGINNSLFYKNFVVQTDLKAKKPAFDEVKNLVEEGYNLKDVSEAENEIDKLKLKIGEYEKNISNFKLADQYKDVEERSNELTKKIKDLWYQNDNDKKKISLYEESYILNDDISAKKISNIYKDLNQLLATNIKKTLDEALKFRKHIATSRKDFLSSEISLLQENIGKKEIEIGNLEEERSKLFEFLEAKQAIKDLSEAYLDLSRKRDQMNDLEAKIKTFQDLKKEIAERKQESAKLYTEIITFSQEIRNDLSGFRTVFFEIHNAIYPENKDGEEAQFKFDINEKKDAKVDMNVILPSELSYGKNRGRTLIYDLTVLFYAIKNNIRCPRFLIHDGIFDGIDKAHFVHLCDYLENISKKGIRFQYIITLNEEGTLSEKFGNADKVNPEKIEEEAIITLRPSKPLFDKKWK